MSNHFRTAAAAIVAFATLALKAPTNAELVTGWVVHNGTQSVAGAGTNSPTFTAGDNITVMAPFSQISLANDGDFITAFATLTMNTRSTTGINTLNTQLRIGLFNGPAGPVVAGDTSNVGFIIEYTNVAAGGLIREQTSLSQVDPFNSPTNIGNGSQDSGANSIQGANPGPVNFELTLTRNGGKVDLTGKISGTDAGAGNAEYLANYSRLAYSSTTFPANGTFTFNRIGLFLGDNVNAANAGLSNVSVTNVAPVPESQFGLLAVAVIMGSVMMGLQVRRSWLRKCPVPA